MILYIYIYFFLLYIYIFFKYFILKYLYIFFPPGRVCRPEGGTPGRSYLLLRTNITTTTTNIGFQSMRILKKL